MQTAHYGTLVIRPHSMQFAIDELPLLLLCLAGYGCAWIENLAGSGILSGAVSYTHLTLPTSDLV